MKSCLGCPSFAKLVTLGATVINTIGSHLSDAGFLPPANLPPNPQEFVGEYVTKFDIPPHPEVQTSLL